jgi:hypothetical protein
MEAEGADIVLEINKLRRIFIVTAGTNDISVGSYLSLLLTACSNMALRYVWQILHVLTCSYNELSTFLNVPILISSSASGYIVMLSQCLFVHLYDPIIQK